MRKRQFRIEELVALEIEHVRLMRAAVDERMKALARAQDDNAPGCRQPVIADAP
jgi:hypothetical protein